MKNLCVILLALSCLILTVPAAADSAPTPGERAVEISWVAEPISFGQFTEAAGASAGELSLRGCNNAYNNCMIGCQIQCQNHPFPPICLLPCEQSCRLDLAACVSIVIAIGVLV